MAIFTIFPIQIDLKFEKSEKFNFLHYVEPAVDNGKQKVTFGLSFNRVLNLPVKLVKKVKYGKNVNDC
jgi:hypothetical protein